MDKKLLLFLLLPLLLLLLFHPLCALPLLHHLPGLRERERERIEASMAPWAAVVISRLLGLSAVFRSFFLSIFGSFYFTLLSCDTPFGNSSR